MAVQRESQTRDHAGSCSRRESRRRVLRLAMCETGAERRVETCLCARAISHRCGGPDVSLVSCPGQKLAVRRPQTASSGPRQADRDRRVAP